MKKKYFAVAGLALTLALLVPRSVPANTEARRVSRIPERAVATGAEDHRPGLARFLSGHGDLGLQPRRSGQPPNGGL